MNPYPYDQKTLESLRELRRSSTPDEDSNAARPQPVEGKAKKRRGPPSPDRKRARKKV